jgi:hypothetical protein
MRRHLAVLASAILLLSCKPSSKQKPPAISPEVVVSAVVVGGDAPLDAPLESDEHEVAVGFGGTGYLVVWSQPGDGTQDDVWGARLTESGEPVGEPFPISAAPGVQQTPAVAFDGENWLVVFQDHRVGQYFNVYGARVRAADGAVLDPDGVPIAIQSDHQARPAIAFDGTGFLVVWADRRTVTRWDVYGTRVTRDGTVVDANGIVIAAAPRGQINPAIAFDGTNYLVAWQDVRLGGDYDVRVARVTPAGAVLDRNGVIVSGGPTNETRPAVVFDGQTFVVAWEDQRSGTTPAVYAARVTRDGGVVDGSGIPVSPAAGAHPAVAFDGEYTLVAWHDPSAVPTTLQGARLDDGAVVDPAAFLVASGTGAESLGVASDRAGRALVAYDAVDAATGEARVRARVVTDWALLSVEKAGNGGGVVTSAPEGIECGDSCAHRFDAPTEVTLAATPDGDSVFGGWSGACSGAESCTVTTDVARSVTATFRPLFPLTVAFGGAIAGTVTSEPAGVQCGEACSSRFVEGTAVELTATGIPGYSLFSGWAGDCGPTATILDPDAEGRCGTVMDGPRSVTATFVRAYALTLKPYGSGAGTLALGDARCASGAICKVDVEAGASATLTATASAGSVFKAFSGCTAVDGAVCTTVVSVPKTVTAKFEPSTIPLAAATSGSGAGTVSGAGLACTTGSPAGCAAAVENPADSAGYTTVTLTATPRPGSVFKSWSGCIAVPEAPSTCTLLVSGAKTVTAKFEPSTIPLTAVTSGSGAGTVSGAGLACTTGSGAGCTAAVENPADSAGYSTVTLTGTPRPGSVLKTWSGCTPVPGAPSTCTVEVRTARTVTARFDTDTVALYATTSGSGSGTVTGAGLACTTGSSAGCAAAVENPPFTNAYAPVTLEATASAGSVFKAWSACTPVEGAPRTCTTIATPGKTVTAKFEPDAIPLGAATSGTGGGTVTGAGLECTTGSPEGCSALVSNPEGAGYQTVTLTASANAASVFKSWSGCTAIAGTSTCTITVSAAKWVTAKFEPSTVPLNAVTSGTGAGTVTGAGLDCTTGSPSGCTAAVENPENTTSYASVTLTATPLPGSVFKSWSGCTAAAGATCTVTATPGKTVTAKFEPDAIALSAGTSGTGAGTVTGAGLDCSTGSGDGCTALVPNPGDTSAYTVVTLTATAQEGSVFKTWSGCTAVAGTNTCTLSVSAAKWVTAKFEPATIPLSAATGGAGAGTVTGAGLDCSTGSAEGCTTSVENPESTGSYTVVTLTATPAPGSVFKSWSGCIGVAGTNTCTISVSAAKSVTAKFEPATIPLTVLTSGTGTGTVTGPGISCTTGSSEGCAAAIANPENTSSFATVTLTAAAGEGSTFGRWSGCVAVYGAPETCTVTVGSAKTVTATFVAP